MENQAQANDNNLFTKFAVLFIGVLIVIALFRVSGNSGDFEGNVIVNNNPGEVAGEGQTVKMYVQGGQYILEPSTFKVGQKVRIEAEISRVPGCAKSVVIGAFGVRKTLTAGDNVIEFTPTKAGTFNIACSMNMYQGTFIVLDAEGKMDNYIEAAPTGEHSCGGSGGGCGGCGG